MEGIKPMTSGSKRGSGKTSLPSFITSRFFEHSKCVSFWLWQVILGDKGV